MSFLGYAIFLFDCSTIDFDRCGLLKASRDHNCLYFGRLNIYSTSLMHTLEPTILLKRAHFHWKDILRQIAAEAHTHSDILGIMTHRVHDHLIIALVCYRPCRVTSCMGPGFQGTKFGSRARKIATILSGRADNLLYFIARSDTHAHFDQHRYRLKCAAHRQND